MNDESAEFTYVLYGLALTMIRVSGHCPLFSAVLGLCIRAYD